MKEVNKKGGSGIKMKDSTSNSMQCSQNPTKNNKAKIQET